MPTQRDGASTEPRTARRTETPFSSDASRERAWQALDRFLQITLALDDSTALALRARKNLMSRIVALIHVLILSLAVVVSGCAARVNPKEAKIVAEVERLGGTVAVDEDTVIGVDLMYTDVTDAGLEHLKGLTNLQSVKLTRTKVTDAGLEHLKGSAKLDCLILAETSVTDAGLGHIKGLSNLQWLNLYNTQVSDAGSEHLA